MKRHISTLLLIGAALFITTAAIQAADQPDAASLYKQKCSMCHGADGKGFSALKTPNFTDPKYQKSVKDKDLADAIKDGKKGTAMPAFANKLKEDEIQALVEYIRSLNSEKKK